MKKEEEKEGELRPPPLKITEQELDKSLERADVSRKAESSNHSNEKTIDLEKELGGIAQTKVEEVPMPPIVRAAFCLVKCLCFVCMLHKKKSKIEPYQEDPDSWEYDGPLEAHSSTLRALMCPRDASSVFEITKRVMLGKWKAMTIRESDLPINVGIAKLVSRFGARATSLICQLMTGGEMVVEVDITEFTVFVCRFSLMSATALCILLFRAAAGNVKNFVSEACLSMGQPVESLLDVLRNCSPDSSPTLRRSQNVIDRQNARQIQKLERLAEKRGGDVIYLADFRVFIREVPDILMPMRNLQRSVWNVFGGVAFWGRLRRDFQRRGSVTVSKDAESRWRFKCEKCRKRFRSRKKLRRHEKSGTCSSVDEMMNENDEDNERQPGSQKSPSSSRTKKSKSSTMLERRVSAYKAARRTERIKRNQRRKEREEEEKREREKEEERRRQAERTTKSFPKSEATSCVICLEDVSLQDSLLLGKCGHLFHSACITKWLDNCAKLGKNRTCALCRANWETANESPGLSTSSSSKYRVPSPKSTLISSKMKLDDDNVQEAWQWRHQRAVRIDGDDDDDGVRQEEKEKKKESWQRYMDLSGAVYYYEPLTSRFRWDEEEGAGAQSNKALWVQCVDEESGRGYYYNTETGESRWMKNEEEEEEVLVDS